jgi:hypothetical protein
MLNAKEDDLDLKDVELEFNPLTEEEWAADCAERRKTAETPDTPEEWHWRFNFLANIRLQILESERLTIDELIEQSEHQLAELMVWFLGLGRDEQTRHAAKLKATLIEVTKLKELTRQKALALIKRDYGIDEVEAAAMARQEEMGAVQ